MRRFLGLGLYKNFALYYNIFIDIIMSNGGIDDETIEKLKNFSMRFVENLLAPPPSSPTETESESGSYSGTGSKSNINIDSIVNPIKTIVDTTNSALSKYNKNNNGTGTGTESNIRIDTIVNPIKNIVDTTNDALKSQQNLSENKEDTSSSQISNDFIKSIVDPINNMKSTIDFALAEINNKNSNDNGNNNNNNNNNTNTNNNNNGNNINLEDVSVKFNNNSDQKPIPEQIVDHVELMVNTLNNALKIDKFIDDMESSTISTISEDDFNDDTITNKLLTDTLFIKAVKSQVAIEMMEHETINQQKDEDYNRKMQELQKLIQESEQSKAELIQLINNNNAKNINGDDIIGKIENAVKNAYNQQSEELKDMVNNKFNENKNLTTKLGNQFNNLKTDVTNNNNKLISDFETLKNNMNNLNNNNSNNNNNNDDKSKELINKLTTLEKNLKDQNNSINNLTQSYNQLNYGQNQLFNYLNYYDKNIKGIVDLDSKLTNINNDLQNIKTRMDSLEENSQPDNIFSFLQNNGINNDNINNLYSEIDNMEKYILKQDETIAYLNKDINYLIDEINKIKAPAPVKGTGTVTVTGTGTLTGQAETQTHTGINMKSIQIQTQPLIKIPVEQLTSRQSQISYYDKEGKIIKSTLYEIDDKGEILSK